MTQDECTKWWVPARKLFDTDDFLKFESSKKVAALLGLDYPQENWWGRIQLTDDLKRVLEAMVGPHSLTVIKMLEARKGEQCTQKT